MEQSTANNALRNHLRLKCQLDTLKANFKASEAQLYGIATDLDAGIIAEQAAKLEQNEKEIQVLKDTIKKLEPKSETGNDK